MEDGHGYEVTTSGQRVVLSFTLTENSGQRRYSLALPTDVARDLGTSLQRAADHLERSSD